MLDHFIKAQDLMWERIIDELTIGKKQTHWMWFVFPQIKGLGRSYMAKNLRYKTVNMLNLLSNILYLVSV